MGLLKGIQLLRREIKDYLKFNELDSSVHRVVFYAEDASSYSYFKGLVDQLTDRYHIPVCYFTSVPDDPLFHTKNAFLHVFYVHQMLWFLTKNLTAKVFVMTMPDLDRFHVKRSRHGINHVYLFHNIGSSFPVIRFGALFHYDTIFCVGPHHRQEIRRQEKLYGLPGKELVDFGYYRLDKIFDDYKTSKTSTPRLADTSPTILIAPSWGDNSLLNVCGRELIQILLDKSYQVIVRPHPMTRKYHPQMLHRLNDIFFHYKGYRYEDKIESLQELYDSDLLVSDWSGITYEYALGTERPVLFVDVPQKIVNERYEEVGMTPVDQEIRYRIGDVLDPTKLHEADEKIKKLLRETDHYLCEIRKAREELVFNLGCSSEAGAHYIVNYLTQAVDHAKD